MSQRSAAQRSLLDARHRRVLPVADHAGLSTEDALELLSRVVEAQAAIVASGPDPVDILAAVTERAQDLTAADGAVLEIRDGDAMVYWSASGIAQDQIGLRMPVAGSMSGLCMEGGETLYCRDSELDGRVNLEACRRVGLRSMVVVPLRHGNRSVGVLKILSEDPEAFRPADTRMIEHLAALAGASLHRATEVVPADATRARSQAEGGGATRTWQDMNQRLTDVIGYHKLRIAYQPIVRLSGRQVVGWEALARFPEEYGLPTSQWFEDAARCGRSVELELAAVEVALAGMEELPRDTYLALNVSPEAACSEQLSAKLQSVDPRRLVLEITEHTAVEDYARLAQTLMEYQERGFRVAIDDAGAGFSSLRHVLTLAPDIIKLDISLVRGVDRRPRVQALVAALCTFAEGTHAALIGEGIETEDELQALRRLGVVYGQGYHTGHPDLSN